MPKRTQTAAQFSDAEPVEALGTADHLALRLWLRMLGCHNLMEGILRTRLRDVFEITLPRFDLMSQLDRHPEGLKMRDVSRLLMVTGGNVTGLTDRLVEEGLVVRRDDPNDRRAYFISLTPKGKALFADMAARHEEWVTSLLSPLDDAEQQQLCNLLAKLKSRLADAPEATY